MAAITSNGTNGNFSSTGTWVGGVVPVAGDTVTIAPGDNVVGDVLPAYLGSDPATGGTAALTLGSSAQATAATFTTNQALQLRGDLTLWGTNSGGGAFTTLTITSGGSLIMNPKSGAVYKFNFNGICAIDLLGTTNTGTWPDTTGGNHVICKTDLTRAGAGANAIPVWQGGIPVTQTVWGGFRTGAFVEFTNIGNATTYGIAAVIDVTDLGHGSFGAGTAVSFTNCTMVGCNFLILAEKGVWTGSFVFNDVLMTSSVVCSQFAGSAVAWFTLHDGPSGGSVKQCLRSAFDGAIEFDGTVNFTFQENVVGNGITTNSPTWSTASMFSQNVVVVSAQLIQGSIDNCYIVAASGITQWLKLSTGLAVTNCVFEQSAGSSGNNTQVYCLGSATVKGCIQLPCPGDGFGPGILVNITPNTGGVTVEHCLCWGSGAEGWGVGLGSIGTAVAGDIVSCRANMVYHPSTAGSGNWMIVGITAFKLDAVTVAGWNGMFNESAGTNKYNAGASSATVNGYYQCEVTDSHSFASGLNAQLSKGDFVADPQFVDHTRKLSAWSTHVGGAGTYADALARLAANPSLIPSMMTWVRAGFVPTSVAYQATSYPGDASTTDANGSSWAGGSPGVGPMSLAVSYQPWIYGDQIQEAMG